MGSFNPLASNGSLGLLDQKPPRAEALRSFLSQGAPSAALSRGLQGLRRPLRREKGCHTASGWPSRGLGCRDVGLVAKNLLVSWCPMSSIRVLLPEDVSRKNVLLCASHD